MSSLSLRPRRFALLAAAVALACAVLAGPSAAAPRVTWMRSVGSPGTPKRLDRVGVLKIGRAKARNVLVFEPGTSAGSAYFAPFARWLTGKARNWQVWSVERRENLLEDQSVLTRYKQGKLSDKQGFDYYLGFIRDQRVKRHLKLIDDTRVGYAHRWGLRMAVGDLHRVIAKARARGGRVVLAGHSLGGSVVTAYATWDFAGTPGAAGLAGLVYDDGASGTTAPSRAKTQAALDALNTGTPWLAFSQVPAPYLGLYSSLGSTAALRHPDAPSLGQSSGLLPPGLSPPVRASNIGEFGYATDTKTSTLSFAAQAHMGTLDTSFSPARWKRAGAITPIRRYAAMLAGDGLGVDGTEWYFPARLTLDTGAIDEGRPNPAQKLLGLRTTRGRALPRRLRLYAFGAAGGRGILASVSALARQSHIPRSHLRLVDRHKTYAHNDPASAYPRNAFLANLLPFLRTVARGR